MTTTNTSTQKVLGVDVYHGDSDRGEIQFGLLKNQGVVWVWAKASQGLGGVDPKYGSYRGQCDLAVMHFGAYHFFTGDDPTKQAQHFLLAARPKSKDVRPLWDVETAFNPACAAKAAAHELVPANIDLKSVGGYARVGADYIKAQLGVYPVIYSGQAFYEQYLADAFPAADFDLNIARYGAEPTVPCLFHQFSESRQFNGQPQAFDADWFHGTIQDFSALLLP